MTIREMGDGENSRPTPQGEFDGTSRAAALKALLAKHDATAYQQPLPRRRSVPLWRRLLGMAAVAQLVWAGPRLTPAEAARILLADGSDLMYPKPVVIEPSHAWPFPAWMEPRLWERPRPEREPRLRNGHAPDTRLFPSPIFVPGIPIWSTPRERTRGERREYRRNY